MLSLWHRNSFCCHLPHNSIMVRRLSSEEEPHAAHSSGTMRHIREAALGCNLIKWSASWRQQATVARRLVASDRRQSCGSCKKGRRSAAIIGGCCRNIGLHPRVGNAYATCGICFWCGDAEAATAVAAIAAHVADATVDAAAGCRRLKPRPHNYRYRCTSCTRCTRDAFSTLSSLRQIRCVVYGPLPLLFPFPSPRSTLHPFLGWLHAAAFCMPQMPCGKPTPPVVVVVVVVEPSNTLSLN